MRNIWTIAKRELRQYFNSPIAYAVMFLVMLVQGLIFYVNYYFSTLQQYVPDIRMVLSPMVTIFLFTTPAITMRLLADEQKTGTLEVLMTKPIRDWELIVGKWLGAFLFYLMIIVFTWVYPLILSFMVKPGIDLGLVLSGYLGIILIVAAFIAVGVFASSLFSNQIAVFFTTLGILLVFWLIDYPGQAFGGVAGSVMQYLGLTGHFFNSFYNGVIELKDLIYYLSMTIFALFLGSASIESRRWR
ncbi:ABC transporter permease [Leptolinea sp. HRD-7]|jgi:ABC-2 type transport system permease protein|nr:ABC transporter permease [Leptolinea sp. HRD-7]